MRGKIIFFIIWLSLVVSFGIIGWHDYALADDLKTIIDKQLSGPGSLADIGLPSEPTNPYQPIINIVRIALGTVAFIFLVLIIYAGFRWMTSGGSQEVIDSAKKTIKSSLIGLLIIFLSYAVTVFVFRVVLSDNGYGFVGW